jgi:hypothetical protein
MMEESNNCDMIALDISVLLVVPWLRVLVVGFAPQRPEFAAGSIYVEFVVNKMAVGVRRFYPVCIIPP